MDTTTPVQAVDRTADAGSWTVGGLLSWTAQYLLKKGSEFPRLDAEVLLAHALGWKRIDLYARFEEPVDEDGRRRFRELVRRRVEGCPVAYLVGRKEFYSLPFEVSPAVLIPRPDTETLVGECLRLARGLEAPAVLDVGTGSGNIAVAVARHHPGARVTAVDLSAEALAVAARNAERSNVAGRLQFLQGNLFAPLPEGAAFDFVLSNPPYIPTGDIDLLPTGVKQYEPRLALDGGADGYAVLERLIRGAGTWLKPGGYLIVEIGAPQETRARELMERQPELHLGPTLRDHSGHPRVLTARKRP